MNLTPRELADYQHAAREQPAFIPLPGINELKIKPIDKDDVISFLEWEPSAYADFEWRTIATYKFRDDHALDFAIWANGELCGLCFACTTPSLDAVHIDYLQGASADDHPLKGHLARVAIEVVDAYASLLGAEWVVIQNPLDGALPVYRGFGFDDIDGEGLARPVTKA